MRTVAGAPPGRVAHAVAAASVEMKAWSMQSRSDSNPSTPPTSNRGLNPYSWAEHPLDAYATVHPIRYFGNVKDNLVTGQSGGKHARLATHIPGKSYMICDLP